MEQTIAPVAAMDNGPDHSPSWCDWLLRWFGPCFDTLVIGNSDNLPGFIRKRHSGLIDTFERMVASLFDSTMAFCQDGSSPQLQALSKEFEALRNKPASPDNAISKDARFKKLLEMDAKLIALLPINILVGRHWMMIDRLRRVAPERAIALYEASNPAAMQHLSKVLEENSEVALKVRADVISINNYLQQLNILNVQREYALASIKWWLVTRLLAICMTMAALLGVIALPLTGAPAMPSGIMMLIGTALIFLGGMAGAITSIGRKFQDIAARNVLISDPFNDIISLNSGRQSVAFSIVVGGVFAIFVYLLIVSGSADKLGLNLVLFPSIQEQTSVLVTEKDLELLSGANSPQNPSSGPNGGGAPSGDGTPVVPTASPGGAPQAPAAGGVAPSSGGGNVSASLPELVLKMPRKQDNPVIPGVAAVSRALGFFYFADILRMLLLAFLAGFAERLVPDAIDRLARRERSSALRG